MGKTLILIAISLLQYTWAVAQPKYIDRFTNAGSFNMHWTRHDLDGNRRCGWIYFPYDRNYSIYNFFGDTTGFVEFHGYAAGMTIGGPRTDDFLVTRIPIPFNKYDSLVIWAGGILPTVYPDYTPDTLEIYTVLLDTSWIDRPMLISDYRHLNPFASIILEGPGGQFFKRHSFPLLSMLVWPQTTQDSMLVLGFRKRTGASQNYNWIDQISIESPKKVGISEPLSAPFSISPNPSNGDFYLQTDQKIQRLTLLDCYGKTILSIPQPTSQHDFSYLVPGIYFYTVQINNQLFTGKWVKK